MGIRRWDGIQMAQEHVIAEGWMTAAPRTKQHEKEKHTWIREEKKKLGSQQKSKKIVRLA